MALLIFLILLLNLVISFWNAYAVGKAWVETKHSGGWPRFMAWMGAAMSALGFTWCYLVIATVVVIILNWLTPEEAEVMLNLGYILVIPGVLFSGLMITLDSWANAYRRRTVASAGVAGYNTFAQIYNTYQAIQYIPDAFARVLEFFIPKKSSSKDSASAFLIILIVILALFGGILTTAAIINRVAASDEPLPIKD